MALFWGYIDIIGFLTESLDNEDRKRSKEEGWVDNFQKYKTLEEEKLSPAAQRPNSNNPRKGHNISSHERSRKSYSVLQLPTEDLVLMDMYHLDERQKSVYDAFVELLSSFDKFDQVLLIYLIFLNRNVS